MPNRTSVTFPALLALAIPVLAGLSYLYAFNAQHSYLVINASAWLVGSIWILVRPVTISRPLFGRIIAALSLLVLAAPLAFGTSIDGVTRWIAVGPFQLHSGAIAIPLLAGAAVMDRDYTEGWLLAAILLGLLQPDAGTLFAITGLTTGLYFAKPDWKAGAVGLVAFLAALIAHSRGVIAPQPFVEHVIHGLIWESPTAALSLSLALLIAFALIMQPLSLPLRLRAAMAGTFAGFSLAALMASYPSILIGYGAAPIIGFALALGINWVDG